MTILNATGLTECPLCGNYTVEHSPSCLIGRAEQRAAQAEAHLSEKEKSIKYWHDAFNRMSQANAEVNRKFEVERNLRRDAEARAAQAEADWRGLRDAVFGQENCPIENRAMVEVEANRLRKLAAQLKTDNDEMQSYINEIRVALHTEKDELTIDAVRRVISERDALAEKLKQAHSTLKEIIEDVVNHPGEFDADSEIVRIAREAIA